MQRIPTYILAFAVGSGFPGVPAAWAQQQPQQPEYLIKARYIVALADYVNWPGSPEVGQGSRPMVLGLLGTTPFDNQRNDLFQARQVKGKQLVIRNLASYRDCDGCDIVFIGESESPHLQDLLKLLKGKPVLTIADTQDFARRGVMINLFQEAARVRFEINLASVRSSGLEVGSRVLKLAKLVD